MRLLLVDMLQADAGATLRGRWPSYREALLSVRDRLKVRPATQHIQQCNVSDQTHKCQWRSCWGMHRQRFTAFLRHADLLCKTISVRRPKLAALQVDCPSTLPTAELETEIYVHMLETYAAANNAQRQSAAEVNSYAVKDAMDDGDGTAASK